jgi:hypothetical protein
VAFPSGTNSSSPEPLIRKNPANSSRNLFGGKSPVVIANIKDSVLRRLYARWVMDHNNGLGNSEIVLAPTRKSAV